VPFVFFVVKKEIGNISLESTILNTFFTGRTQRAQREELEILA
jgi:hypothetical protein